MNNTNIITIITLATALFFTFLYIIRQVLNPKLLWEGKGGKYQKFNLYKKFGGKLILSEGTGLLSYEITDRDGDSIADYKESVGLAGRMVIRKKMEITDFDREAYAFSLTQIQSHK